MKNREFREMFLAAGLPEDQIDAVLGVFYALGGACEIMSLAEYATAIKNYALMSSCADPDDTYGPVARYLISLGARIVAWEDRAL